MEDSKGDNTITLDTPIKRGDKEISQIELRKPEGCGWLRGVSLGALLQMDATAVSTVLPRITEPPLTDVEIRRMDPADLTQCAIKVATFLLPKSAQMDLSPDESKTPTPTLQ